MNKRARNRLIAVTATILVAAVSVFVAVWFVSGAKPVSVADAASDSTLVGKHITVSGAVVAGSWNQQTNPMRFEIRDENSEGGPTVKVVFTGGMPSTFGDGVAVEVTGTLAENGTIESSSMITKCPSKYETSSNALTVSSLLGAGDTMIGRTTKVSGTIVAGSIQQPGAPVRFVVADSEGATLPVGFDGGLGEGVTDGATVVLQGALEGEDVFVATSVSLAEEAK